MSSLRHAYRARAVAVVALILTVGALGPVAEGQQAEEKKLTNEQLEALVSPIALYPDELLSQVLMASTYPLEVVEAARWQTKNAKLEGEALAKAIEKQGWDASVKSLVNFPQVLTMMNERLSWTQDLGNAVLGQQKEVMEAVQRLRGKANEAGNLKTTEQQTVIIKEETIVIQPAQTEVIYVPTYSPTVVYGAWPYPAYPPPRPYYPAGYVAGAAVVGFAAGVALSHCWGYAWGGCNWNHGHVDIDVDRNVNRNRDINRERNSRRDSINKRGGQGGRGSWNHNPKHRKGVGYADRRTAQRYDRGGNAKRQQSRQQFRGRSPSSGNKARSGTSRSGRSSAGRTGRSGSSRSSAQRSRSSRSSGAFGGSKSGRSSRSNASRGRSSRSSSGARRSSSRGRSSAGRSRGGGGRRR